MSDRLSVPGSGCWLFLGVSYLLPSGYSRSLGVGAALVLCLKLINSHDPKQLLCHWAVSSASAPLPKNMV